MRLLGTNFSFAITVFFAFIFSIGNGAPLRSETIDDIEEETDDIMVPEFIQKKRIKQVPDGIVSEQTIETEASAKIPKKSARTVRHERRALLRKIQALSRKHQKKPSKDNSSCQAFVDTFFKEQGLGSLQDLNKKALPNGILVNKSRKGEALGYFSADSKSGHTFRGKMLDSDETRWQVEVIEPPRGDAHRRSLQSFEFERRGADCKLRKVTYLQTATDEYTSYDSYSCKSSSDLAAEFDKGKKADRALLKSKNLTTRTAALLSACRPAYQQFFDAPQTQIVEDLFDEDETVNPLRNQSAE